MLKMSKLSLFLETPGYSVPGKTHHIIFSSVPQMSQFNIISSDHTYFRPGVASVYSNVCCFASQHFFQIKETSCYLK